MCLADYKGIYKDNGEDCYKPRNNETEQYREGEKRIHIVLWWLVELVVENVQ